MKVKELHDELEVQRVALKEASISKSFFTPEETSGNGALKSSGVTSLVSHSIGDSRSLYLSYSIHVM